MDYNLSGFHYICFDYFQDFSIFILGAISSHIKHANLIGNNRVYGWLLTLITALGKTTRVAVMATSVHHTSTTLVVMKASWLYHSSYERYHCWESPAWARWINSYNWSCGPLGDQRLSMAGSWSWGNDDRPKFGGPQVSEVTKTAVIWRKNYPKSWWLLVVAKK